MSARSSVIDISTSHRPTIYRSYRLAGNFSVVRALLSLRFSVFPRRFVAIDYDLSRIVASTFMTERRTVVLIWIQKKKMKLARKNGGREGREHHNY